jgi:hypothetical protein
MVEEVANAKEVVPKVPVQPCQGRHQWLVPARIGSGNKGKDGDMLCTSIEKILTYIGTNYGGEAAQEWTPGKKIILSKPAYSQVILDKHAARVKANRAH